MDQKNAALPYGMTNRPRVSVIVPAYNEEELIGGVIDDIRRFEDRYDLEIIMIEGGSTDRTADVARAHGARVIQLPKKRGKGADFWTATLAATGTYIIQIDADHQFQPSQLPEMMALFEQGADVVLGTRFRAGSQNEPGSVPPINNFGNRFLSLAVTLAIGQRITDTMAGYKGIRREVLPTLQLHVPHFGYEAELVIRSARAGWKIKEMPVIYKTRHTGASNVSRIKDGFRVLGSIIEARCTPLTHQIGTCPECTGPMKADRAPNGTRMGTCLWCGKSFPQAGADSGQTPPQKEDTATQPHLFARLHPFAWIALIATILYAPVLFFNNAFFDFDMVTEGYAYASYFADQGGGWLAAQYTNGMYGGTNLGFNPDNNLFGFFLSHTPSFIPFTAFFHWIIFGYFLLFLWFSYLFFKDRGFSPALSAGLTALVGFSERIMYVYSAWLWVASFFLFPAMCVMLRRLRNKQSWKTAVWGGILLAFALLSGHIGAPILFSLPLGAYAVFLFVDAFRADRGAAKRFAVRVGTMLAIGAALSAWYLLPVYRLALDTPRGAGLSFAEAQEGALAVFDLPRLILPQWSFFASSEGLLYLAFPGLLFALISLLRKAASPEERFWRWTVLIGLIYAVPYSPLAYLFTKVPILSGIRAPARALYFIIFGTAYLAGSGIRALTARRDAFVSLRRWRALQWGTVVLILCVGLGMAFDLFGGFSFVAAKAIAWFDAHRYAQTTGLPLEHYHNVIRSTMETIRNNFRPTQPLTLVTIAGLIASYVLVFRRRTTIVSISLLIILLSGGYALAKGLPLERMSADVITRVPESARFIQSQPSSDLYRVFTYAHGASKFELLDTPSFGTATPEEQTSFTKDLLNVNTNLFSGIQSIDGYDQFMTRRAAYLLNEIQSESIPTGNKIARSSLSREEKNALLIQRLNILGMMNVKYIVTAFRLEGEGLTEVWSGATSRDIPIFIYENAFALPRAFIAHHVTLLPENDEEGALREILVPGRDFVSETLLECGSCEVSDGSASDEFRIVLYAPGNVEFQTNATGTRLVVFNENFLRGWHAAVDGEEATIYAANGMFQGVVVPSGTHTVRFSYDQP